MQALESLLLNKGALTSIERATGLLITTFERKGRVHSCGGGGQCAMHFAEELAETTLENRWCCLRFRAIWKDPLQHTVGLSLVGFMKQTDERGYFCKSSGSNGSDCDPRCP